jgi:hypothetical protein
VKVVIAGSRVLPRGQAPRLLILFLASLDNDDVVLIRTPKTGEPGPFERDVLALCRLLQIPVETFTPEPTPETPGRSSVYYRDIELVEAADLVLLFFTPDEAVEGYSGTAHLMDKAIDANRPVYAYTVADDGKVDRVGEHDPDDLFAGKVPVVP